MRKPLIYGALACAASVFGLAGFASGQCVANGGNYVITQSVGTIDPGTTDVGNHTDDSPETIISLPFTWSFYGTPYDQVQLGSNGNLSFGATGGSTAFGNGCLPSTTFTAPTMCPYWDDLRTDAAGSGIFTSTTGDAPHRIFNIEWRATFFTGGQGVSMEVRLYENQNRFDFVYGDLSVGGSGGTIGCQDAGGAHSTQFMCDTANNDAPTAGTVLSFNCAVTSAPSCSLSAGPTSGYAGSSFQAHATIVEGTPASPPYTVSLDASSVGAGTVTLFDDGSAAHGDAVAGDLVYSNVITTAAGTTPGAKVVISTVTDSASPAEFSTCTATFTVLDPAVWSEAANGGSDAGDLPATAQAVNLPVAVTEIRGTMGPVTNDADMYLIHICDPANFSATTVNGTTIDTQLWLFTLDGHGIAVDDDEVGGGTLQSRLTSQFTSSLPAGDYLLAITGYNEDANDDGNQLLFINTCAGSFRCEHGPDGPGAGNSINHWDTGGAYTGNYSIFLTGVGGSPCGGSTGSCCTNNTCRITSQADCTNGTWTAGGACAGPQSCNGGHFCGSADFNCDGDVGTDQDIAGFFACLSGACPALPCISSADFNGDGDVGTDQDIDAFFRVLGGAGC